MYSWSVRKPKHDLYASDRVEMVCDKGQVEGNGLCSHEHHDTLIIITLTITIIESDAVHGCML